MRRLGIRAGWVVIIALILLGANSATTNLQEYWQDVIIQAGIAIIMAVSLNVVNGFTGQFSIGHAGFMALGAYTGGALSYKFWTGAQASIARMHPGWTDDQVLGAFWGTHWFLLPLGMLMGGSVAALFGYLVGVPSLRLRGDYLAIVTLGFGEIIRVLLENTDKISHSLVFLGASVGFYGIPHWRSLIVVFGTAALVVGLCRNLKVSLHGLAFQSIREDEVAADAMGVNTTSVKVAAFALSAFFAGMGGALFAHAYFFVPKSFGFILSMNYVVMIVLGGTGSITGATVSAVILTIIPEWLKNVKQYIPGFKDEYRLVVYAIILILMMFMRPQGVFGRNEFSPFRRRRQPDDTLADDATGDFPTARAAHAGTVLDVSNVTRLFGGLTAVNNLNLKLESGELVGLIGPNGAGKTTVFNLLTGVYDVSSGSVQFLDRQMGGVRPYSASARIMLLAMDTMLFGGSGALVGVILSSAIRANVTLLCVVAGIAWSVLSARRHRLARPGYKPFQFAQAGIARTFQNIRLFPELSVLENVMVAAYVRRKTTLFDALFRTARMEREDRSVRMRAMSLLQRFNLDGAANERASSLAYGKQRRLEIARALATAPSLLLLDEPAAGMNPQEKAELMDDILRIRREFNLTILLIEHDMTVVMGICERIYVLDYGEVIAHGSPVEIRNNPRVVAAYLGEEAAAC